MLTVPQGNSPEVCAEESAVSTRGDIQSRLSPVQWLLLAAAGMALMLWIFIHMLSAGDPALGFTGFLAGAKLLGSSRLYEVAANLAVQRTFTAHTDPGIIFVRMPFWALVMKPFLLLPYHHALLLWRAIMAAVLIACALLTSPARRSIALALCWSIPAVGCVYNGNDSPLILLCILISLASWRKNHHLLAGVFLGLCLAKFHFLVFLPFLLLRKENRRELIGFSLSATLLTVINFVVQPNWIPLYWQALHLPQKNMNARAALMPNFYSTFFWTGHAGVAVVAGAILVAGLLFLVCRRLPFDLAMPLCIFGGLLAAPHTNYLDGILGIPAILAAQSRFPHARPLAMFLLSPVAGLLAMIGPDSLGPAIVVTASLFLLGMTAEVWSHRRLPQPKTQRLIPEFTRRTSGLRTGDKRC